MGKNVNSTTGPTVGEWLNVWFLCIMEYFEDVKKEKKNHKVEMYVLSYNHLSDIWLNE